MSERLDAKKRRDEILAAALIVAARPGGWTKLTRALVAEQAGCSDALVSVHFGTMPAFRRTIMRAAIKSRTLAVVAQGLAQHDPVAMRHAPRDLQREAMAELIGG